MDVIPAIDLLSGRCVRLYQETTRDRKSLTTTQLMLPDFGSSRSRLHRDLDGAKTGRVVNQPAIEAIMQAVPVPVQGGGGAIAPVLPSCWIWVCNGDFGNRCCRAASVGSRAVPGVSRANCCGIDAHVDEWQLAVGWKPLRFWQPSWLCTRARSGSDYLHRYSPGWHNARTKPRSVERTHGSGFHS